MRSIDPDSEENQRQSRENANEARRLQLITDEYLEAMAREFYEDGCEPNEVAFVPPDPQSEPK